MNQPVTPGCVWILFVHDETIGGEDVWEIEYAGTRDEVEDQEAELLQELPDARTLIKAYEEK